MDKKWPIATLALLALCVLAYLWLSGGEPYVYPLDRLDFWGVSLRTPWGALTYSFLHVGIKHLIGNALVILGMGLVVERVLGARHTLGIFLASGVGAGIAYAFAHPNALVIGSSAAISGLLLAGYLVDVKKAFLVLAAALILIPAFVYPGVNAGMDWLAASRTAQELQASAEEQLIGQQLAEVRGQIEAGNATPENVALEQNLTQLAAQASEQWHFVAVKKQTVVVGRAREEATPVSFEIHVIGMVIAAAYLLVFRKDAYRMFIDDFKALWRWTHGFGEHRGKTGRKRA